MCACTSLRQSARISQHDCAITLNGGSDLVFRHRVPGQFGCTAQPELALDILAMEFNGSGRDCQKKADLL